MYNMIRNLVLLSLYPILAETPSCIPTEPWSGTYAVNTFQFVQVNPPQNIGEAIPKLWIDTNMKLSSLTGGTLSSSLPCSVKVDYTDNGFAFRDAVITNVTITYDDGTIDRSPKSVDLPLRIGAKEYELVNSVAGGRTVTSKCWHISGEIPNVITRAEPFRLQIEGHFTKDDSEEIPFAVDQRFDIKTENTIKSAAEVLQDK